MKAACEEPEGLINWGRGTPIDYNGKSSNL